uniref:Pre-rRNA-processing protein TSR1 homolog n=1 Tax=Cacopsylla melanoneura TaxID=428564 RepID=A0A8D8XGS9_9HEMI
MTKANVEQQRHRPGLLKQTNKTHKHGKHKSKGSLETLKKGKVNNVKALSKKLKKSTREDRRNQATQIRRNKRDEVLSNRRKLLEAPFMVAVVPLSNSIVMGDVMQMIETADSEAIVTHSSEGHLHISLPRFKQRFTFVLIDTSNMFTVLDALKAADNVLFLMSPSEGIDSTGHVLLTAIIAQGLPTTAMAIFNLNDVPIKKRNDCKLDIEKKASRYIPDEKVTGLSNAMDVLNILRKIGNQKQRKVVFRDRRPHLLAEKVDFIYKENDNTKGVLKVTGYLRGQSLNVNALVHIPGWGDFQMKQIDISDDPHPLNPQKQDGMAEESVRVLDTADPAKQVSLQSEIIPDPMDAEQTWPTKEELDEAASASTTTQGTGEGKGKAKVKRIPKGFSEYQAAWIPDSDAEEEFMSSDEDEGDSEGEEEDQDEDDAMSVPESNRMEEEDPETMSTCSEVPVDKDKYDKYIDLNEEEDTLRKLKEARMDAQFPDELDTPLDTPARVRFQKYRGLESFRTSAWDTKENLPLDFARIFQFQNFDRTRKRVLKQLEEEGEGAQAGWYITVHIDNVTESQFLAYQGGPLLIYGLLPHEQKMSVLNMLLKRPATLDCADPIASKEELWFQTGYRRYKARPIFSQHTNGNKHKYERFFQPEATVIATCFAPIMFPPAPVLAFKKHKDESVELVALGSVHSVNPDRIVVKRVILSGHPLKIHKRSATVRFMFFNREDIDWFKPVELRTKYGRRGHIKEPLGTHGHMKCLFDGQLKSQDTVLMTLYKRVFPKWAYELV